jgi:hypothetical protein
MNTGSTKGLNLALDFLFGFIILFWAIVVRDYSNLSVFALIWIMVSVLMIASALLLLLKKFNDKRFVLTSTILIIIWLICAVIIFHAAAGQLPN